jgi:predicted ATPase
VLDNCEQVHAAVAELAASILRVCPHVYLLATSRQPLDAPGEQQWPVSPLAEAEAARLFADRAHAVRPSFGVDESNTAAVTEICRRLDGMPLALELAAARVAALGPAEIAARLDARFRLLKGGGHNERHQTLRSTIDWSYSLLDETQQRVFDRLGVFPATFDAAAAVDVAGDDTIDDVDVLDALAHLVDQSMLIAEPGTDGTMRYELLETLRQYALERLGDEDLEQLRWRHAEHYAARAAEVGAGLISCDEVAWRQTFDLELENIRTAMTWGVDSTDDAAAALAARMVADIGWLAATGPWRVGQWAQRVIERDVFPDEAVRYTVYGAAAHAALGWGEYEQSRALALEGLRNGMPPGARVPHITFNALACSTSVIGDIHEAMRIFATAIDAMESIGASPVDVLVLEGSAAMVEAAYGWIDAAEARARRVLPFARTTYNRSSLVGVLVALAWATLDTDPDGALAALDEAIVIGREGAQHVQHGIALSMAADLRCRRGDVREAIDALRETVVVNSDGGDRGMLVTALERSVPVLVDAGQLEPAVVIANAVVGPFALLGYLPPNERVRFSEALERAIDALDPDVARAAAARGDALSLEELVIYSLGELDRIREELGTR